VDASTICSGTTLFGVAGTATCPATQSLLQSNANRNLASTQLTISQEVSTYAGSSSSPDLPSNYREIPNLNIDDDGFVASTVNQYGTRPQVACGGTAILTVANKIADCLSKNGANAIWDGSTQGTAGQPVWKLVFSSGQAVAGTCSLAAMSTDCYEVWQDQRTGLLWSSVATRFGGWAGPVGRINHCLASGNSQNIGVDCSVGGSYQYATTPGSACSESSETGGVQAITGICSDSTSLTSGACTGGGGTWSSNTLTPTGGQEDYSGGNYSIAKGYMGAKSSTQVRWRLPTKSDYHLANLDGLRMVMPDMGSRGNANGRSNDGTPGIPSGGPAAFYWASTVLSSNRSNAWILTGTGGIMRNTTSRSLSYLVRCVGR
jgi:hypothetical protein